MTQNISKTALYKDQQVWFFTLLTVLVTLFTLYVYFLADSVFEVVLRKEVERNVVAASSAVSSLEATYATLQHGIDAELALSSGYTLATEKTFIDRTDTSFAYGGNR